MIAIILRVAAVSGAPQRVRISNITLSTISLTWSPPLVSERHGLTISGYVINCSTESRSNTVEDAVHYTDSFSATLTNLHPFTTYNCCVAANSNHGRGNLACQSTVTWDQGVYCVGYFDDHNGNITVLYM